MSWKSNFYTAAEDQKIREMWVNGKSQDVIAAVLRRPKGGVVSRITTLGLRKVKRTISPRKNCIWTRADDDRHLDFLDAYARGASVSEAADQHGVSRSLAYSLIGEYWAGEPAHV